MSYVGERPWWPIQSPNKVRKKKEESEWLRGEGDQIMFIDLRFEREKVVGLSELCWGKAMVAYAKPQQSKKEERRKQMAERRES